MAASTKSLRYGLLTAATGLLCLVAPAPSLEPVFSNDGDSAVREIKVCILLLAATHWENPEPFFLPTLASDTFQRVRNERPASWRLTNPLAPSVVTAEIANLWDKAYGTYAAPQAVTFDGVTAAISNDYAGNGNVNAAAVAVNQGHYNGSMANQGGPNTYWAHCQPTHLNQFGTGGTSSSLALPAVGQPIPRTHPAYWEVPLTPVTVSQLANFDAVFVNTHRNLSFTAQEQTLLRQFLDQGGTLYLEDSHGSRLEVKTGGNKDLPEDVDFFLPFQFVDGFPWPGTQPNRPFDGYPINSGSVTTLSPSKYFATPQTAQHPLFNGVTSINAVEADRLGDVRAKDHLIIRSSPANYLVEDLLLTTNSDVQWGQSYNGLREPALAVARVGAGKLVLSGIDMIDDCSKPYETGNEPDANILPDIKFMFNLLGWKSSVGGNRRGGVNNQGVGSSQGTNSLLPRQVWTFSDNWTGPTSSDFATVDNVAAAPTLGTDANRLLKEPLCAANGIVYVQYEDNGTYWLCAVDAKPEEDLDGDGQADDGPIRDVANYGATSDTIWRRDMGSTPIAGATVVSVRHDAAGKPYPIDVLLCTQVNGTRAVRLWAFHATVDDSINSIAPADTPGSLFYNWTTASSNWDPYATGGDPDGYVDLDMQGDLDPSSVSAPVVYNDLVYVTGTTNFDFDIRLDTDGDATPDTNDRAPAGEWLRVVAVRLVPVPSLGAVGAAGRTAWEFPDRTLYPAGEFEPGWTGTISNPAQLVAANALKQVDFLQYQGQASIVGGDRPDFIAGLIGANQFRHFEPSTAPGTSRFVPTLKDSLNLTPVIGITRDARTGLSAPYVFLNRANGDVWAVSADPDALGWKLEAKEEITAPALAIQATASVGAVATDGVTITNDSTGLYPIRYDLTTTSPPAQVNPPNSAVFGNLVASIVVERDRTTPTDILEMRLLLAPEYARSYEIYTPVAITYTLVASGRTVALQKPLYPRQRLLRGNRHSGYENASGAIELLGWSTGAPMLYDAETAVGTSSALWRGALQPAANYETGSTAGNAPGAAYQLRSSSMVSFFDAAGDDQDSATDDANHFGALKWAFDTGLLLSQDIRYQIDGNLITSPGSAAHAQPAPQIARTASVFGSPVRYGDAVVVAGAVHSPSSGNPDVDRGFIAGINPNPVLSAPVVFALDDDYRFPDEAEYPVYLCGVNPLTHTFSNTELASHDNSARPLRQYLVDPGQYRVSWRPVAIGTGRLQPVVQLRGDEAHLFRAAQSVPDSNCAPAEEPIPELFRAPLYGRRLWLVCDRDRDGVYGAGDELGSLYIPSPVQWCWLTDVIHFHPQNEWSLTAVTDVASGADLAGSYTLDDVTRPVIRFTNTALRGRKVRIDYTTSDGLTTRNVYEVQYVPDRTPGFNFSPVVAGDTIYLAGTMLGSLGLPAIPTFDRDGDAVDDNGGIYSFNYGRDGELIEADWLRPDSVPGWPNFSPTGLEHQYARGVPVAADDQVFVSFVLDGDGTGGGADNNNLIAPLYALGGRRLLVTEAQRVAEVDYEGRILTQFTGTKEKIGAERPADTVNNNPVATDLLTTSLSRPSRAYNVAGDHVLVVDTGNDRVVETDQGGLVVWPLDSRTGHPDGVLRFLGLRDLGLERPRDAVRVTIPQVPEHPLRDGNAANAQATIDKTATVIADTGNHRVVMVVSQDNVGAPFYDNLNTQSGGYTYYEPLLATQAGFGAPWALTPEQVYNPTSQKWLEVPYVQVQDWDPVATDIDTRAAATAGGSDRHDRYYVVRVDGSDQLFNLDPDPNNNGLFDENNDGEVDGLERNLAKMIDEWSGGVVFRGLRYFQRFRIGTTPYLAIVQDDVLNPGKSRVVIYEHVNAVPPLQPRWTFAVDDYQLQVYDVGNANTEAYYRRQSVPQALRARWYGSTATNSEKRWDPVSVAKLPNQNMLAIVNGAPNSVNQTSSASEILLVRFDPNDLTNKRVEHMLPDLASTTTYAAGQAASRRRPSTGSYPVSSPVHVTQ